MTKEKKGFILLEKAEGVSRLFKRAHAEKLMKLQEDKGYDHWKVSKDSKYQYKKDNGFTVKRSSGDSKDSEK